MEKLKEVTSRYDVFTMVKNAKVINRLFKGTKYDKISNIVPELKTKEKK